MKRKSILFLLMTTLLLIAFLVPACQKKYELDDQALLQLKCNASDAESIIDEIGETSVTTVEQTETEPSDPSEPTVSETTEATETTEVTETTKATTVETTIAPTPKPTATPTPNPSTHVTPVVTVTVGTNSVTVSWNKITGPDFAGYKVVASVSDSTPMYSENGYYAWITDANVTSCTIDTGDGYNDGDVGCFSGGTSYYFSVTAVYSNEKIAGNAVYLTMPGAACTPTPTPDTSTFVAPVVTAVAGDQSVIVSWNKITHPDLVGYKVVASTGDSTPMYPANGHYEFFTDANITSCTIKNGIYYNDGDFRNFSGGVSYYFSVTAVYVQDNWQYVAGNAVQVTMPTSTLTPTPDPSTYVVPVVTASVGTSSVIVSWNKITSPNLVGYKVVASVGDSTPMYSENGYYEWITDLSRTSCTIKTGDGYHDGDVGCFAAGTTYYFSVTAIYNNDNWKMVAGNAVQLTMPS